MKQEEDRMIVGGTFKTMSTLCHSGMLTNGRMVLSGNFYEKGDPYSFDSTDQFTVAFVSTNDQYVHYDHRKTSQIANTEGDYILDEDLIDKTCLTIDAVSYGIADGLGELAESPEEIVVAGAGAAAIALGVSLGNPYVAGAFFILGIVGGVLLLKETYQEMSEIDNDYEKVREVAKEVTKVVVISIVMKAGEKAGEQAGELIKDTSLWQKCCKILKKKKPTEITEADLQKIAMTAAEHLESVKGCMDAKAFNYLLGEDIDNYSVDLLFNLLESINSAFEAKGKKLNLNDIKYLFHAVKDEVLQETINKVIRSSVETTRVGRWMSREEYDKMYKTEQVQLSGDNKVHVANPCNIDAFRQQAEKGSVYVEFDVPNNTLFPGGKEGWGIVAGPGSLNDRLNIRKGLLAISDIPTAKNIEIKGEK